MVIIGKFLLRFFISLVVIITIHSYCTPLTGLIPTLYLYPIFWLLVPISFASSVFFVFFKTKNFNRINKFMFILFSIFFLIEIFINIFFNVSTTSINNDYLGYSNIVGFIFYPQQIVNIFFTRFRGLWHS